jgi:hypothetical protein
MLYPTPELKKKTTKQFHDFYKEKEEQSNLPKHQYIPITRNQII